MTKLSDTQAVILSAASHRDDLSVLPLPESLKIKGGALNKVMDSLRNRGLIRVIGGDGGPERVIITGEAMAMVGVEDDDEAPAPADTAPKSTEADSAADIAMRANDADSPKKRMKTKPGKAKGKKVATTARATSEPEAAAAGEPSATATPRAGTKQALMVAMLKRPEGATVEQIAATTGWQHHTIRGAISGALRKKLGLTVESEKVEERGRVYRIPGAGAAS
jgi:Protein of unknown function (DUF3489)